MNDKAPLPERPQLNDADVLMGKRIFFGTAIVGFILLVALALPRIREMF
jgi:hypothetical protein